jgi:radical SAM protein with 4Fe4S-binding SPASM domain
MINLEITEACNLTCRHCYNFWRQDDGPKPVKLTEERMSRLIDMMVEAEVFHVVLSGGEPLANYQILKFALKRLQEEGISTSVNSNLMPITTQRIRELKAVGLDHVLTSLNSANAEVNDYMVNKKGALADIIKGIKVTIAEGVRVSVNMIISDANRNDIYETARLCSELGVQKLFATRLVPSIRDLVFSETDRKLGQEAAIAALDEMVRARDDFGIAIGTLISYPLCLLGDLEKYKDFVGRGCPAQRGNRMVINATGATHACTHEEASYGDVFEIGIKQAFQNMSAWHDGSFLYEECHKCRYVNVCNSGCASASQAYYNDKKAKDPLFKGFEAITTDFKLEVPPEVVEAVENDEVFTVPDTIRFRQEDGFYSLNVRWANTFSVDQEVGDFLRAKQKQGAGFRASEMVGDDPRKTVTNLVYKEAIVPDNGELKALFAGGVKLGCSIDPDDLLE